MLIKVRPYTVGIRCFSNNVRTVRVGYCRTLTSSHYYMTKMNYV